MLKRWQTYFKGDKSLWGLIALLSLLSFSPVYSAGSNLEYVVGNETAHYHFIKHVIFIFVGFVLMYLIHNMDYQYFGGFSLLLLPVFIGLLVLTWYQGLNAEGAAARWLKIPGLPITFQPSVFANIILLIYVCRFLSKRKSEAYEGWKNDYWLFFYLGAVVFLILPSNGSMALMIFTLVMIMLFLGNYPIGRLILIFSLVVTLAAGVIYLVYQSPELIGKHRVQTWQHRIENFLKEDDGMESYQVMQAKAAIIRGGIVGQGPGKSALKQTLPQSSSDFIFPIIVEEYGWMGVLILLGIYILILVRINVIANRANSFFGTLLVYALGIPIIFQAFLNMAVSVNLLPVTGQPLPLISLGGTSMWATYISFGIILSVSRQMLKKEELEKQLKQPKNDYFFQDIA